MKLRNEPIEVVLCADTGAPPPPGAAPPGVAPLGGDPPGGKRLRRFIWRGRTYRVEAVSRPWYVDSRWWSGRVSREYLRVRTDRGTFIVYRERHENGRDTWSLLYGED